MSLVPERGGIGSRPGSLTMEADVSDANLDELAEQIQDVAALSTRTTTSSPAGVGSGQSSSDNTILTARTHRTHDATVATTGDSAAAGLHL